MTDYTPLPVDLPSVRRKKLTVDFAGGNQSSNGGLLLLREAERKRGVCLRLVAVLIVAQKLLPGRAAMDVPVALAIVGLGILIVIAPSSVPGLMPPLLPM
jgi:hypothetical protein